MNKLYVLAVCVIASINVASAEVVLHDECEAPYAGRCTIHQVRISPCPEAVENQPCKIKRGKSASIEFDYTTQFNSTTAYGLVSAVTQNGDLQFPGMNTEACQHTSCPLVESAHQTYAYTLNVAKKFPARTYTIRWVLRNPEDPELGLEKCCFTTRVKLVR